MPYQDGYLGNEAQRALLRRGRALHLLTRDDPTYGYYGRTVGVPDMSDDALERVMALTELQGNSFLYDVPEARFPELAAQAEARGFNVNPYDRWIGAQSAIAAADDILTSATLPNDLSVVRLSSDTPPEIIAAFDAMALTCGVLPPVLSVLTGEHHRGLCYLAVEQSGRVVSCAAASAIMHPDHPLGKTESWWGMLATDQSRRGERLSLWLGARALFDSHERFGFTSFYTGVASGNAPSEAVCTKLGLSRAPGTTLTMADRRLLPGGRMTK